MSKRIPKNSNKSFEADPTKYQTLQIESVDLDGQGVTRSAEGKVVFVEGALIGERVVAQTIKGKNAWESAKLIEVLSESALRVTPKCPHFGLHQGACGGCKLQHIDAAAQVAIKARSVEENLWRIGKVKPERRLRSIQGPSWGYRYRARLSVRVVAKRGVLIGFHERASRYIADMPTCEVLPPHVSALLVPLRGLIARMSTPDRLPQIELAVGDAVTALVLRHMEPLTDGDKALLREFAANNGAAHPIQWWLQPKGPDTVHLLDAGGPLLAYTLSEFGRSGIRMPFKPTDFTQVNHQINDVLVSHALKLLAVQPHERVIDWFCGLGNFTLPLATQAAEVLGIEGSEVLVERARTNADAFLKGFDTSPMDLSSSIAIKSRAIRFEARNLFEMTVDQLAADGYAHRWLIDPPREGAFALAKAVAEWHQASLRGFAAAEGEAPISAAAQAWQPPERIVYVSCDPSTLSRDAGLLVHQGGYRCTAAGVVNMFPHTAHVESVAVFERD
jgi:23S rRNA (uracil1939-C5)-methyltransferase